MTTAARIAANRRNALASTGPRTSEGKVRAAQNAQQSTGPRTVEGKAKSARNALRHGLTQSATGDPAWSDEIKALARAIAGADANPARHELACRIAEAQVDVARARRARTDLYPAYIATMGERGDGIVRLAATSDYERRALARRNRAIRELDEYDNGVLKERTEPTAGRNDLGERTEPKVGQDGAGEQTESKLITGGNSGERTEPKGGVATRENEPKPPPEGPTRENEPNPIRSESDGG